jgi:hypothetical protein
MTMFQNLHRMMEEGATLKIECETCKHGAAWTREQAFKWLGPDAIPSDIRQRLSCSECGTCGRVRVWI